MRAERDMSAGANARLSITVNGPGVTRSQIVSVDNLRGPAGLLEAVLNTGAPDATCSALVCHPHPPSGGTLHNKVVYHAMKAFSACGVPVLRFNFRGVGRSEGMFDEARGEQDDVRAALDWLEREFGVPVLFAGFSFGSYVGLRACCGDARVRGRVGLGLPVRAAGRDYTYEFLEHCEGPKLFISGDHDQFSPIPALAEVVEKTPRPREIVWVPGADHFFAGVSGSPASKLPAMQAALLGWLASAFDLRTQ